MACFWASSWPFPVFLPDPWLHYPATIYIHFFRGLPLILVIFWLYFLSPVITGRSLNEFAAAVVSFIVFEAAYFAEIIRAGIQSISRGQIMASQSTGMTPLMTARFVILPQALRNMTPAWRPRPWSFFRTLPWPM